MSKLLVFASEECMGWEETRNTIEQLRSNPEFHPRVEVLDPTENQELFRDYDLTVCPSFLLDEELIAVGPASSEQIQESFRDRFDSSDE